MNQPQPGAFRPYEQVSAEVTKHPLRQAEVPVEHHVSLPLPTLRWALPSWAVFAGPARRAPGQPLTLGTPDRWWALDARHRGLLGYALTVVTPFTAYLPPGPVIISPPRRTITALKEDLAVLGELLDAVAPAFFAGETGDPTSRADLLDALTVAHLREAAPWYRALVPDFFTWLEG